MGRRLRACVGPAVAALGCWCAAGAVTVADSARAGDRLVTPAPWWVFAVALIGALAIRPWRRHPALALPAALSTIPWWPVPLPAIALIWTGPLAWLPILVAVVPGALGRNRGGRPAAAGDQAPRIARDAVASAVIAAGLLVLTAWTLAPRLPGGDEPHYLVITQSLLQDHDLRIANNHRRRDYAAYFGGTLNPDYRVKGRNGEIYSIHAPGVSALVAPAFAAAGYRGAQATIIAGAALAAACVWLCGWQLSRNRAAAWFGWAAFASSVTFLVQGVTIFPDGPAMAAVALALFVLSRVMADDGPSPSRRDLGGLAAAGVALALLPWLHSRFVVIAAVMGAAIAWAIVRQPSSRAVRLAALLGVPILSAIAWLGYFQVIYGAPSPAAAYGPDPDRRAIFIPGGMVAVLFDQQFGLFVVSPVLATAVAGWAARGLEAASRRTLRATVAVVAAYLAAVGSYWMWWAGVPAPPARFAAAVLPLLAVPAAVGFARARALGRSVAVMLLVITTASTALLIGRGHGDIAWQVRGPVSAWLAWLGPVVDLARGWPSFFYRLTPQVVATERLFFVHVAVACAVCAAIGLMTRAILVRRPQAIGPAWAAWSVLAAVALATFAGWVVTGSTGIAAAASQWQLLRSIAAGEGVLTVTPLSMAWVPPSRDRARLPVPMTVAVHADAGDGPQVWARWPAVPAGAYQVVVTTRHPASGSAAVRIGRSQSPVVSMPFATSSRAVATVTLPAGADTLSIEGDASLAAAGADVAVVPVRLERTGTLARGSLTFPAAVVFFLDDGAFAEAEGFWVRGGGVAALAAAATPGTPQVLLDVTNGGVPNRVTLRAGARGDEVLELAAGENRTMAVPLDGNGTAIVTLSSAAGFRPADGGGSADTRYLGVFVRVR